MLQHGPAGAFDVLPTHGFEHALVLSQGLGEAHALQGDAAGFLLNGADGRQHQRQHAIAGERREQTVERKVGVNCLVVIAGAAQPIVHRPQLKDLRRCDPLGRARCDLRLQQNASFRELTHPLIRIGQLAQQRRTDGSMRLIDHAHTYAMSHLQQSLDLEPLDGLPQRGATDPELFRQNALRRQPLRLTIAREQAMGHFSHNRNTLSQGFHNKW